MRSVFADERKKLHSALLRDLIGRTKKGCLNFADSSSPTSVAIAEAIYNKLHGEHGEGETGAQQAGKKFEEIILSYVESCFAHLSHLRPGYWSSARNEKIYKFEQYEHLKQVAEAAKKDTQLSASLGSDYIVKPDIVIQRLPEDDSHINSHNTLVDTQSSTLTPLRSSNQDRPLLHASISCKWTIRSDRSQNSRTEALNLIRNRKGRVPHIVVVTAEPLPSRITSIALGTGDVDCTYHFALPELIEATKETRQEEAQNLVRMMVEGKRLRDISDLPFDLAI